MGRRLGNGLQRSKEQHHGEAPDRRQHASRAVANGRPARLGPVTRLFAPCSPRGQRSQGPPTLEELRGRRHDETPCLRLALAVLDDALKIVLAERHMNQETWIETVEWILGDDASWVFSFRTICDQLDVDPARIRTVLRPWVHVQRAIRHRPSGPQWRTARSRQAGMASWALQQIRMSRAAG